MLRLTLQHTSPGEGVLQIDGKVAGPDAAVVQSEIARLLAERRRLVLDLAGVPFVDAAGVAVLCQHGPDRLALVNVQPYVRALLERHQTPAHPCAPIEPNPGRKS